MRSVDVAVIGAGTAGAAAAALCAARGLSVVVLEARGLEAAGARWVNAVPDWCFEAAGLPRPDDAVRGDGGFHLVCGWGPERLSVPACSARHLDMRVLVERLQQAARDAGATLVANAAVRGRSGDVLDTAAGPVRARFVVDASGLAGARLVPGIRPPADEICAAAQEVRDVADAEGARRFLAEHGVAEGESLCFTGVAGGFSVVNVRVDGDEVSLLTGSIPALGQPSGPELLERFVRQNPWIGARRFGGSRAIPLRRPPERLAHGPVALLGDAASQVYGLHGSGIGAGLVAARILADALASGEGVDGYNFRWQRRFGGAFAAGAVLSRFSRTLELDELRQLVRAGVMTPHLVRGGLEQQAVWPALTDLPGQAVGVFKAANVVARLVPAMVRAAVVQALYASYPEDPAEIDGWAERLRRVSGETGGEPPPVRQNVADASRW